MANMRQVVATLMFGAVLLVNQAICNEDHGIDMEKARELEKEYTTILKNKESKWLNYDDKVYIYLYRGGGEHNENMAGYAVQNTIVKTHTGATFPQSAKDWELVSGVKEDLDHAVRPNRVGSVARLVLFDNEYGVKMGHISLNTVKQRTEAFVKELNIPCIVLISVNKDRFRKPHTGMFHLFEQAFNGRQKVNLSKSFYKGYASGGDRYGDHDRKFAENLGVEFREA